MGPRNQGRGRRTDPATVKYFSPIDPTHNIAAPRDASISARVGWPCSICTLILTGFSARRR
jgi:hypothetical protein